jgi:dynamin 1-like protein
VKFSEHLDREDNFFKTHPSYAGVSAKCGTPYLSKTLNEIIVKHIKECLPSIRSKITSMLFQKEKELKAHQLAHGSDNQQHIILNIIAKYAKCYEEFLEGKFVRDASELLKGGSRLNYIFYDLFTTAIGDVDPFDALTDSDIQTAIRNCGALKPNLFIPEVAFEILSKQQINRLESPSL